MSKSKIREQRIKARKARTFKRRTIALAVIALVVVSLIVVYQLGSRPNSSQTSPEPSRVLLQTSMGDIAIELYDDMPVTTSNFKKLVKQGIYDGTIFHRVIDGFMIQGGDPTGTGYGDPSIPNIPDEFSPSADHIRNDPGTVAMANTGEPNSGNSQFFINLVYNQYLDRKHPVFGKVVTGMDVVDAIGKVQTDTNDKPVTPVTIIKAQLVS